MGKETIYVDSLKHCHRNNNGETKTIVTDFFAGKCDAFVEGYIFDDGDEYTRIYPWKDYAELDAAQREYERQKLAEAQEVLNILLNGEE